MESLQQLHDRICKFAPQSLYFSDSLDTRSSESLICKVNENGSLKPFFGNTVVFLLDPAEKAEAKRLQACLYTPFAENQHPFTAQPLKEETLHMTLHDLANPTTLQDGHTVENTRAYALEVLSRVKQDFSKPIKMRPKWLLSMMHTSILLGLLPADEDNCRRLLGMYECFHEVVPLKWPYLTPHITLAYYKPMDVCFEDLQKLRAVLDAFNQNPPDFTFRLRPEMLVYQEFDDMNSYRTITAK